MRKLLVVVLALLLAACATPSQAEALALRDAHTKLVAAKEASDAAHKLALTAFRDELITRTMESIDQAVLDEIGIASKDGLEEAEVRAINKKAAELRAAGLNAIQKLYAASVNTKPEKDYNDLWTALDGYWQSRLSVDIKQYDLVKKVFGGTDGVR